MSPAHRTRASESGSRGFKALPHLLLLCRHHQCQAALCRGVLSVKENSQHPARGVHAGRVCSRRSGAGSWGGLVFMLTLVSVAAKPLVQGSSLFRPEVAVGFHPQLPVRGCSFPRSQSISFREGLGLAGLRHIPTPDQAQLPLCSWRGE